MYSKILVFSNSAFLNTTPRSAFIAARQAMRSISGVIRSYAGAATRSGADYAMISIKCCRDASWYTPVRLEGGSGTGGQGQFLTRTVAQYQAILDIATYLSLNKLLGHWW